MSNEKQRCAGRVWDGWRDYGCSNTGRLEHDDKMWCKTHHPPTVEAKMAARREACDMERQRIEAARNAAEADRRASELRETPDDVLEAECVRRGWEVTRG